MRVSAEGLKELRANLAKRTIAALDEREGIQARDYQLAREVDAGLTVGQVLANVDDLEEAREQRRVLREALEGVQYDYYPASRRWYCVGCNATKGEPHRPECQIEKALTATEDGNG